MLCPIFDANILRGGLGGYTLDFDRSAVGDTNPKVSRFVIWTSSSQNSDTGECETLLKRLGLNQLSDLDGLLSSELQPKLREEVSFLLDYTERGKLCTGIPREFIQADNGPQTILDQGILTLRLSNRAFNSLNQAGIQTIAELVRWTPDELLELPSLGKKSLEELISALAGVGINSHSPDVSFSVNISSAFERCFVLEEAEFAIDSFITLAKARISEGLRSQLAIHNIRTLGDLAAEDAGKLLIRAKLERHQLVELADALRSHGLRWGMNFPSWQKQHWPEISRAFDLEISNAIIRSSNSLKQPEAPPTMHEVANSLTDELESLFPRNTDQRNRMIVKTYLGLNGDKPQTLEATAQQYGLTRERVRQIANRFERSLSDFGKQLPWLEETISVLKTLYPCLATDAEEEFEIRGIVTQRIKLESLLKLSQIAGLEHDLVLAGKLLLGSAMVETLRSLISHASRIVTRWGIAEKNDLLNTAPVPSSDKLTTLVWVEIQNIVWLDTDETYFWMPTKRNPARSRLLRILRVAPDLSMREAYNGILRDGWIVKERLPFAVFPALCRQYDWCAVAGDRLEATAGLLPPAEQDSNDDVIAELLRETSGIAWRDDLWNRAQATGIGKSSFDAALSDSPIFVRHDNNLYGLIGSSVPNTGDDFHVELREGVSAPDRAKTERESSELGVIAGCDPASKMFPFQVAAMIRQKSEGFAQAWSLSELKLSRSDIETIRMWGKVGSWNVRRQMRRKENIGRFRIEGWYAICLTFLLFCSEIAREDSIEGELWPTIQSALGGPLREALFGYATPKVVIRDGTEDVCRMLRLRHVFGRDGEQSWLRTVFLQFGFTRKGIKNLDRWLATPDHVPVAVDDLLDSSRGLMSDSFVSMWRTLQELRQETINVDQARETLKCNPWLRTDDQPRVFSAAQSSRLRQPSGDDEDPVYSPYHLLVDQRLRLTPEPGFEFHLNPIPPAWCEEERYTLEVGPNRFPISRSADGWKLDHSQVVWIPLVAIAAEVDLSRRRQSVMPQKLVLNLAPLTDLLFYDLNSGIELSFDQLSNRGSRGTAILYKVHLRLRPEAEEFAFVFDGMWKLALFREGLPKNLCVLQGERMLWQGAPAEAESKRKQESNFSLQIEKGWWGDHVGVNVFCPVGSDLHPRTLVTAGQTVSLTQIGSGEWRGTITLTPEINGRRPATLFYDQEAWLRRQSVAIPDPQSAGVAVQGENGWIALTAQSDIDTQWLRGRRILVRPPAYEGIRRDPREWALLEGDRLIARPGNSNDLLQGLEALGEELALAYGPYNNREPWHRFTRSVLNSGCVGTTVEDRQGQWTIGIMDNLGLGIDHALWVWRMEDDTPVRLERSMWGIANSQIVCQALEGTVLGFAVAFQGVRLGSRLINGGLAFLRNWIENCRNWKTAAEWLRWWRVPVRHPDIRVLVEMRARSQPVETTKAWLTDSLEVTSGAKQIEPYEAPWQSMTRICLWGWSPNELESATILKALSLWTGDFQSDAECENFDCLLATNPMLLAQVARNGAALLYEGAAKRELAALIRCLRNRILPPPDGLPWHDAYEATCSEAAKDLNVDDRFLQKSIVGDARRYVRGDAKNQRNLKLALDSMLLRRIVASRLLEDTAEEWTKQ